jgi:hypothetical protein
MNALLYIHQLDHELRALVNVSGFLLPLTSKYSEYSKKPKRDRAVYDGAWHLIRGMSLSR